MGKLDNRVAVVTGAARGIGAATARALAAEGAAVVVADVLDAEGKTLAGDLGDRGHYSHLDVTSEENWQRTAAEAEQHFGPVSILVNNAGIVDWGGVEDESLASFRRVIDVNLQGTWLGMHTMAPLLRRAGGGVIVNISSTAGITGYAGISGYVASKWAIRGLTKAAALELGAGGIRVCSVHPGAIHTAMTAGMDEDYCAALPVPRYGEPEEIAAMVRFLVAEASYATGAEFVVDGGATAGLGPVGPAAGE